MGRRPARSLKTQQRERLRSLSRASAWVRPQSTRQPSSEGRHFELQAQPEPLATSPRADLRKVFTESLILAQDERWRRA